MKHYRKFVCLLLALPMFFLGVANGYWDGEPEVIEETIVAAPIPASAPSTSAVTFSHPGGLYTAGFNLALSASAGLEIWFTTDGSDPLPGVRGTQYIAPIRLRDRSTQPNVLSAIPFAEIGVDWHHPLPNVPVLTTPVRKATIIRAQAFDTSGNSVGGIATHSFFIMQDIHTRYAGLPIVSLVTHFDNFFHINHGIYINGVSPLHWENWIRRGGEWERPASMEIFETDGSLALATDIGVRIHGGASRTFPQKSLRLYARSDGATRYAVASNTGPAHRQGVTYFNGVSDFNLDLFQGAAVDSRGNSVETFRHLILRNGGQDGYGSFFRDAMLQQLAGGLNVATQAYRPVVVFLNGEFWGLYNLRERYHDRYFRNHFGIHQNNVSLLEVEMRNNLTVSEGAYSNRDDYRELLDTIRDGDLSGGADNALYRWVQVQMCVDSYIDHFAVSIFMGATDWPHNNMRFWRYVDTGANDPNPDSRVTDGRWRWTLSDLDCSTGRISGGYTFGWNSNNLAHVLRQDGPFNRKFQSLMENDDFRARFINRMMDLMNTHLSEAPFLAAIDTAAARIAHIVPEQAARWYRFTKQSWQTEVESLRNFARRREGAMHQFMQAQFNLDNLVTLLTHVNTGYGRVAVNGLIIDPAETQGVANAELWAGRYFAGMTQRIQALPARGERLYHFLVNGEIVRANADNTIFLTLTQNTLVIPIFSLEPEHIPIPCPLAAAIAEARPIRSHWVGPQRGHTPASWAVFELALAEAERTLSNRNATPAQMNAATTLLRDTMAGLELVEVGCGGPDSERHPAYMFGVGRGAGDFAPRANISRAEVAAILVRTQLSGFTPVSTLPPGMDNFDAVFTDVNTSHWFYYYVAWAYDAGLVQGDDRGRFRPNDPITREQFAIMLARTTSGDIDSWNLSLPVPDADAVSDWATRYVGLIYHLRWMMGDDRGNFNPRSQITRAEVATAVNRILGRVACRDTLAAATVEYRSLARQFPDVPETAWYFPAVFGAGNDHSLIRNGAGAVTWKRIVP
ncbi:MAG: CotH kinase family protein [Oscillospiraceae bacterium]|nr:CotH kinase family protein [Oscillospiraceae bacterium]